jgi:AcrR family transcriptional regulator
MIDSMGRWMPGAAGRLVQAAMELYSERGYEQTTVAEIAARAGVTERTFFRHFTDKREVLFSGAHLLRDDMVAALESLPASTPPIDAVRFGIERFSEHFTERDFSRRRQAIIDANPVLRERELIKLASYASDLNAALVRRGVPETTARLAADVGIAAFRIAWERWLHEADQRTIHDYLREAFDQLKSLSTSAV